MSFFDNVTLCSIDYSATEDYETGEVDHSVRILVETNSASSTKEITLTGHQAMELCIVLGMLSQYANAHFRFGLGGRECGGCVGECKEEDTVDDSDEDVSDEILGGYAEED